MYAIFKTSLHTFFQTLKVNQGEDIYKIYYNKKLKVII